MELLQNAGGLLAGLTEKQKSFVRFVAVEGMALCRAAEAAGYSYPATAGSDLARLPHVRAAIVATRQTAIEGDLASLGLRTMRELMSDSLTPAPVRFQAAKWSLEAAGHSREQARAGLPPAEKSLSEMSVGELEEFIKRGESALGGLRRVGAPVIEVTATAAPAALTASGVA
jgi:hypothetical protein